MSAKGDSMKSAGAKQVLSFDEAAAEESKPNESVTRCEKNTAALAELYREVLERIGEDPERDGLKRTPERVAKAIQFLTRGHWDDPKQILRGAMFDVDYDEMVI